MSDRQVYGCVCSQLELGPYESKQHCRYEQIHESTAFVVSYGTHSSVTILEDNETRKSGAIGSRQLAVHTAPDIYL